MPASGMGGTATGVGYAPQVCVAFAVMGLRGVLRDAGQTVFSSLRTEPHTMQTPR